MKPSQNRPLLLAFVIALAVSAGFALLLYLNEDLRKTTYAFVTEEENEEGEIVRKVKVERPEPKERQIREIAEEREKKEREELKEKAKRIRETLIEIEEVADARKEELEEQNSWKELGELASEIEEKSEQLAEAIDKNSTARQLESLPQESEELASVAEQNADQIREFDQQEISPTEAMEQLETGQEMVEKINVVNEKLQTESQSDRSQRQKLKKVVQRSTELAELGAKYQEALERIGVGQTPEDPGNEENAPLLAEPGEETEALDSATDPLADADGITPPTDEELDQMETPEIYSSIQEMSEAVDEAFAENKAAELAAAENLSFEDAQEQIYKPQSDTGPDLAESLAANKPSTLDEYQKFNEALNEAARAAETMRRTAENRRNEVAPSQAVGEKKTGDQLRQALQQQASLQAQMNNMATQSNKQQGNVQDMRQAMLQSYGLQGSFNSDLSGRTVDTGYSSDLGEQKQQSRARLDERKILQSAIPGRRFSRGSERQGWVFLDTWYVIGPWDRPKKNSFETKFPPETVIDLDATYEGKDHRKTDGPIPLKWRFVQTENIRINPPDELGDSVYYAFTEVFAEEAMEVLVAVASDDTAKVWVNDLVVWSDTGLSSWRLDEGFRRILLKPGYNTVLVRVENGPAVCYFSVLMCPADAIAGN